MEIQWFYSVLALGCYAATTSGYTDLFPESSDKRQDLLPFPRIGRTVLKRQGLIPMPRTGRAMTSTKFFDSGDSLDDLDDSYESPFDLTFLLLPYKKRQHNNGFSPRIGRRKKRSVTPPDEDGTVSPSDDREPKKTWPEQLLSPQGILFDRALRQLIPSPRVGRARANFVPRIGKKSSDTSMQDQDDGLKRASFTPRIGRASFTPRIGRASFTPRIGRASFTPRIGRSGCKTDV